KYDTKKGFKWINPHRSLYGAHIALIVLIQHNMITAYQYIYDKMVKKREEMRSYLLGPLSDDFPEEYKPIRELYYTGSAKGKSCVEKMIIKTADDLLLFQLEKMDKLRLLENGQDIFSMELKPNEYNSIVYTQLT
ncbi:hypothetical protein, partial [Xenorhabdus bovienii]|uniref:hypothetical protein n=1 Tax=Xenorhabdus bovienii TaxID=40576 RepID=UPI0023B2B8D6